MKMCLSDPLEDCDGKVNSVPHCTTQGGPELSYGEYFVDITLNRSAR